MRVKSVKAWAQASLTLIRGFSVAVKERYREDECNVQTHTADPPAWLGWDSRGCDGPYF